MRRTLALLAGLLLAAPLFVSGQDPHEREPVGAPHIELLTKDTTYGAVFRTRETSLFKGEQLSWTVRRADGRPLPKGFMAEPVHIHRRLYVAGPPGDYVVTVEAFVVTLTEDLKDSKLKKGDRLPATVERVIAQLPFTLTGDGGPRPPPDPPGPTPPGPAPPDPPTVNPFPGVSGLHLLIVYESADLQNYPREQINSWLSKEVADYMASKGTDNWRRWDKDVDAGGAAEKWKGPFMRARRESLPWVAVGNGTAGYEGPAPKTHAEFVALLKRFGGN
jgi:hypothetical protein